MPRKTTITDAQIKALIDGALDAAIDARDYDNSVRNGYVEPEALRLDRVSALMSLSRDFADLAGALVYQMRLAAMRAENDALIEQVAAKAAQERKEQLREG